MSHPELSFPDLRSLKMYRSIWKAFFVLFFKPCLSTCFCLFKYSYCFYLILSHLTYKSKQMRMQTEIIISLMYSLILRETLLCWLWMPWLRNSTLEKRSALIVNVRLVCLFVCVCVCVCVCERESEWERRKSRWGHVWIYSCVYILNMYFGKMLFCRFSSQIISSPASCTYVGTHTYGYYNCHIKMYSRE